MKVILITMLLSMFLNAIEYKDIDKSITFNMWEKSTSPTSDSISYLKDIINNINKLEKTNLQLEQVLNKGHKIYKSYEEVEFEYFRIVNKLNISKFFYNFEKAQVILVLLISQKNAVYSNDNSYNEQKEDIIKYLYSYIRKQRTYDAKAVQFEKFRNTLRAYQITNFMLKKAFGVIPKILK